MENKFYGYIYKTTNLINNKIYIGKRKGKFCLFYLGSGNLIKQAIKKNGKNNFKVEIIDYANCKNEINDLEILYIDKYRKEIGEKNMYNIGNGGEEGWDIVLNHKNKNKINSSKIVKRNKTVFSNPENRQKLSKTIALTYEIIPNLRENRKNQTKKLWEDEEFIKNNKEGRKKRMNGGWFKNPEETKKNMSLAQKGRKAHNKIDIDSNKAIELYLKRLSVREVSEILNVTKSVIYNRLKEFNIKLRNSNK